MRLTRQFRLPCITPSRILRLPHKSHPKWTHRFIFVSTFLFESYILLVSYPTPAQQQNGATIVLEHRFYGFSNPRPDLTVESLKLHTIQQAIDDLAYFANHVNLPMPGGDKVSPDQAPWILVGGSYAGIFQPSGDVESG